MSGWSTGAVGRAGQREERGRPEAEEGRGQVSGFRAGLPYVVIKQIEGSRLLNELFEYIDQQVLEFNQVIGRRELSVTFSGHRPRELTAIGTIAIKIADGTKPPFIIQYIPAAQRLRFKCGGDNGEYFLVIGEDGAAGFERPRHVTKSVEQIGDELLMAFESAGK
jgi:hypothetical protein